MLSSSSSKLSATMALCMALLMSAVHSTVAFKNDTITCQVSAIWHADFKLPYKRGLVCETVFAPEDKEKSSEPTLLFNPPKNLVKANMDALKNDNWFISFPSIWVSGDTRTPVIDIPSGEKVINVKPDAVHRLLQSQPGSEKVSTNKERQTRETKSQESVVIVRVRTNDKDYPISVSQAVSEVFSDSGMSAKTQFKACTFNALTLVQAYSSASVDAYVNGNANDFSKYSIRTEAKKKACSILEGSESCTINADHIVYIVPSGLNTDSSSSGFAYGSVGGSYTVFQGSAFEPSTILHEFGHNFMLGHAGEVGQGEYGDDSTQMGSSYWSGSGNRRCFNGWNMWEMGWMKDRQYEIYPNSPENKKLATYIDYNMLGSGMVVNIKVGEYYLTFNRQKSFNQDTKEKQNQVIVVEKVPDENIAGYFDTELRAGLSSGQTYSVGNLKVTVCDITYGPPDWAHVAVGNNAQCGTINNDVQTQPPTTPPGSPTASPTRAPVAPPPSDCRIFKLDLTTDKYAYETSWDLKLVSDGTILASGTGYEQYQDYTETFCVDDVEMIFTIKDSYGDGICCGYGTGSYTLTFMGQVLTSGGEFQDVETFAFGGGTPTPPTPTPPTPTDPPTRQPTRQPTTRPTEAPTAFGGDAVTEPPTKSPTASPTAMPTKSPTAAPTAAPSDPPPTNCRLFELDLKTDNWPAETSWELKDSSGNILMSRAQGTYSAKLTPFHHEYCAAPGDEPLTFVIRDSYGDGICCGYGAGSYTIKYDNVVKVPNGGDFNSVEETPFQSVGGPASTASPTKSPSEPPTKSPTEPPTKSPTEPPTKSPTEPPTEAPTGFGGDATTESPTKAPSPPTKPPTAGPTSSPTSAPTSSPSRAPTRAPTEAPTTSPTRAPIQGTPPPTECQPKVLIRIKTDRYPEETSYTLKTASGTEVFSRERSYFTAKEQFYNDEICAPPGQDLVFTIFDSYGDGICCGTYGDGEFHVFYNGVEVGVGAEFGSSFDIVIETGTAAPTSRPTKQPTASPTNPQPTDSPTNPQPTDSPTSSPPTRTPTEPPTASPTKPPTSRPTEPPTRPPTRAPTQQNLCMQKDEYCDNAGDCCSSLECDTMMHKCKQSRRFRRLKNDKLRPEPRKHKIRGRL